MIPNISYMYDINDIHPRLKPKQKHGLEDYYKECPNVRINRKREFVKKKNYEELCSPPKISFGGLPASNSKTYKWGVKLAKSNFFKKMCEKADNNSALCAAAAALVPTCILRPVTIMGTPYVEKENRKIASAKSIASGLIGFGFSFLISSPIAAAVKLLQKNPTIKNSKSHELSARLIKMSSDFICAIPKATMTIALLPFILNFLFYTNNHQQNTKSKNDTKLNKNLSILENQETILFAEKQLSNAKSFSPSFKGNIQIYDKFVKSLSNIFGKFIKNKNVYNLSQKIVNREMKKGRGADHTLVEQAIMIASSTLLSAFYVINIKTSKKIEECRKKPLMYNAIISWAIATIGALTLDKFIDSKMGNFTAGFKDTAIKTGIKNTASLMHGVKILKSALIFAVIYRWISPWLSTILAEKVWKSELKHKKA